MTQGKDGAKIQTQIQVQTQIQIHHDAQVTGERGSLGGLGVPNTVEEANAYQVITCHGRVWSAIHIKERERKRKVGGSSHVK